MDAAAAAPAPVIKRQRKARAVPKVKVYSRHRTGCKWEGRDNKIGCDCPKQLTWFRDGRLHRVAGEFKVRIGLAPVHKSCSSTQAETNTLPSPSMPTEPLGLTTREESKQFPSE